MSLDFHLEKFDGPLDLLWHLIQKSEVRLYDIPIAQITEQFLEYLHSAADVGLEDLSDFYVMATRLIYIKSQMLLPVEVDLGEDEYDPRDELVEQLLEYSKFRKYGELLLEGDKSNPVFNISRKQSDFILPFKDEELWENVNCRTLLETYTDLLKNISETVDEKVFNVYEEVSEKEKIALMNELLEKKNEIKFSELFVKKTAIHVICSFLAVLEAVKEDLITVEQVKLFEDMTIKRKDQNTDYSNADDIDEEYEEMEKNNLQDEDDFSIIDDGDAPDDVE